MHTQQIGFGKLNKLDVRLLRLFLLVVECGGFSQAQARLDMAASTMSTRMSDLEARFGVKLCHRGRGGFRLTEQGEKIYNEARKLFVAIDRFESVVAKVRGEIAGELRVATLDNAVLDPENALPRSIHRFTSRYPEVQISIEILPPDEMEAAIMDGRVDVGLSLFKELNKHLLVISRFSETVELYCGLGHPLFELAPNGVSNDQVAGAAYAEGVYLSEKDYIAKRGNNTIADLAFPSAKARQAEGLAYLILSGKYIGYLPRGYVKTWLERGLMRPLLPAQYNQEVTLSVVVRNEDRLPEVVAAFVSALNGE